MSLKTNPVSSGYSTVVINSNFKKIEEYVNDNLLNRDGVTPGEPNQMEASLDMNSQDILNVGKMDAKEIDLDGTSIEELLAQEANRAEQEADRAKREADRAEAASTSNDVYLLNRANHTGTQEISTVEGLSSALGAKADQTSLDAKVDKVEGKGLSEEDFTTALRDKLDSLSPGSVGIESIVAGSGITVDDSDPVNPIVSAIGGGGGPIGDIAIDDVTGLPEALGERVLDDDPRLSDSRVPTGGAGGVLSGTYPNPDFAVPMATADQVAEKVDKVVGKGLSTNDFTDPLRDKLDGIEAGATANSTDAYLLDRANHTGTQAISTVAGLQGELDAIDDLIGDIGSALQSKEQLLTAGTNITIDRTDPNNPIISSTAAGGGGGDVAGPASATDSAVALFDGTSGKLLKAGAALGTAATRNVGTSDGQVPEFVSNGEGLGGFGYGRIGTSVGRYTDVNDVPKRTGFYLLTEGHPNSTNNKAPLAGFYDTSIIRSLRQSTNDFVDLYLPYHQYSNGMVIAPHTSSGYETQRIVSDSVNLRTSTGNSTIYPMTQKAVTDALNLKLDADANAASATKLATARTINGVSFDGTADIAIPVGITADEWYLGTDKQHTVAAATGATALNLADASTFDLTLTGNVTLSVSNAAVPAGYTRSIVVRIRQGATAHTVTWWAGITWLASATPAAPAVNKIKEYVLSYDGSSWLGREGASN